MGDCEGGSEEEEGEEGYPSMNAARSYLGYATDHSGNAYAIGGLDDTGQPLASAERLNPDSPSAWAYIASLPTPLYNFPAVFDGTNYIYVFGGLTNPADGIESAAVLRYSVKANTWAALASMPAAVAGSAAAMGPDGKIYVAGGTSGGIVTDLVQVYNPAANAWTISTPLPEALTSAALGVDSLGRLIVMGGMDTNGNDVSDVWRSQQLGVADSVPVITQAPPALATTGYALPYSSTVAATGNPQPTFLVVRGPDGLQVDSYSGVITWTPLPDGIGTNPVTIRATNFAGFADTNFTIIVPPPPPTAPTNLIVVVANDTSVTLAWAPSTTPASVPLFYAVSERHSSHSPRGSGVTVWYVTIATNLSTTSVTIGGLAPDSSHQYVVTATAAGVLSGISPMVGVVTTAPQGPPTLVVTGLTSTSVSLAWDPAFGPAQSPNFSTITSYSITERVGLNNVPTVIGITGTNGTVTGLTPGSSHLWFVQGVDASGTASSAVYPYVTVVNPVPVAPLVSGSTPNPDGTFQITARQNGSVLQTVVVQATTNISDPNSWVQIGSFLPSANPFTFTDTNAPQFGARFYRILAP